MAIRRRRKVKRNVRRKARPRRAPTDATIYQFKRSYQVAAALNNSPSADSFGAQFFQLSFLPNYTEFTNLFDAYQITKVVIKLIPGATVIEGSIASSSGGFDAGAFMYFTDTDDVSTPTTMNEFYERQGVKIRYGASRMFNITLRPRAQLSLDGGFGPVNFGKNQWINTANPSVDHYGWKWGWREAGIPAHMDMFVTYHLKFRNVK